LKVEDFWWIINIKRVFENAIQVKPACRLPVGRQGRQVKRGI
jgi:hypothetical protein